MTLTIQEAYKLAVKKWEYIVNNDGKLNGLLINIPELEDLRGECSYCELFIIPSSNLFCYECPVKLEIIGISHMNCCRKTHPFHTWFNDSTKANAQAVLDLIIKTKPF